nr:MAG TPA: Baseplate wedge protein [Caudoviricetes sp.]
MAKDFRVTDDGDLIINPATHDFEMIDGVDEVAQRIRATLLIRYGEMENLDPDQGADYSNFIGKNFDEKLASADMETTIMEKVPEVKTVNKIKFTKSSNRKLLVNFSVTVGVDDGTDNTEELEGGFTLGD